MAKKLKVYDRVKDLLERSELSRNNDKHLHFMFWIGEKKISGSNTITYSDYKSATSPGTISRCRRKIQELHPELRPTEISVIRARGKREDTRGTFIYRQKVNNGR